MNLASDSTIELVRSATRRTKVLLASRPSPRADDPSSGFERLARAFSLSEFEQDLVAFSSAFELDAELVGTGLRPSFSLALAALNDPVWSALTPSGTLRRRALLEVTSGSRLLSSPIGIAEPVLHFLVGIAALDARVANVAELWALPTEEPDVEDEELLSRLPSPRPGLPLIVESDDLDRGTLLARWLAKGAGAGVLGVRRDRAGAEAPDWTPIAPGIGRDATLLDAWLVFVDPVGRAGAPPLRLAELGECRVVVVSRDSVDWGGSAVRARVPPRSHGSRVRRLQHRLGLAEVDRLVHRMASQFTLRDEQIEAAIASASSPSGVDRTALWDGYRAQAREATDGFVERVESSSRLADLILDRPTASQISDIIGAGRERAQVLHEWGFDRESRGHAVTALFAGASGTGKTLAAEVIANELRVDLLRIDLSQVVSKYIGETEKHLRRVFDVAERSGAVLLFDEADALFGKRSEVRDSHDRYANIEVGYLLQKMESYRGTAILTTNMREVVDDAFLRRLRFFVEFAAPDEATRERIWRSVFPKAAPTAALDHARLAKLRATGGTIRSIALTAAYLAAAEGLPISMNHVDLAARREARKLDLPEGAFSVSGRTS